VAPNICLVARDVVRNAPLMDICDLPIQFIMLNFSAMIYSFRILKEFLYDVHDTLSTKPLDHRKATFLLIAHKSFAVERHKFKLKF